MIVELIEVVLNSMLTLVSPEKAAEKVKDTNTSKFTKSMLITLFSLLYGAVLVGISFFLVLTPNALYKALATILIIFLIYCLAIFYYRILKRKWFIDYYITIKYTSSKDNY